MKTALCFLLLILSSGLTVYAHADRDSVNVVITEEISLSFSPDTTGYWTFYTESAVGRPFMRLENEFGHFLVYGEAFTVHLVEGSGYILHAGFWGDAFGRYMLRVSWSDIFQPLVPAIEGPHITAHTMPGSGGRISAYGEAEISFTPDASGLWTFRAEDPVPIWIEDPFGNVLAVSEDGFFTIQLAAGAEYTVRTIMLMWISVRYSVSAVLAEEFESWMDYESLAYAGFYLDFQAERASITGYGAEVFVEGAQWFSFIPDTTGPWTFRTSDNEGDPLLALTDSYGSFFLGDDNSAGNLNARFSVYLAAGVEYVLWARFSEDDGYGAYTLTVAPYEKIYPEDRYITFVPEYTGTWMIWLESDFSHITISDYNRSFTVQSQPWSWGHRPVIIMDLAEGVEYRITAWIRYGEEDVEISIIPAGELRDFIRRIHKPIANNCH